MKKKKYEPPLVTNPELGKPGFTPLGATGCTFGDIGSACANGTEPQGGPTKCGVGNQPDVLDCVTGTTAGDTCRTGTDPIGNCNNGVSFAGDCVRGTTPLSDLCARGIGTVSCAAGIGPG